MSQLISYRYPLSSFSSSSGKVNYPELNIEVEASSIERFKDAYATKGLVYIDFTEPINSDDKMTLDTIVSDHLGQPSRVDAKFQESRRGIWSKIIGRAFVHHLLKHIPDTISAFNKFMSSDVETWIYDGNHDPLVSALNSAAGAGQPFSALLNTPLANGETMLDYLIGEIPATPYI